MRTNIILIILIVIAAGALVFVRNAGEKEQAPQNNLPQFADHATTTQMITDPAPVNFDTYPQARNFETAITEQAAKGPNFAGHYTIIEWGCGTNCQGHAIVDAETGEIALTGLVSNFGLAYQKGSELVIANPTSTIPARVPFEVKTQYYQFDGSTLNLLKIIPHDPATTTAKR